MMGMWMFDLKWCDFVVYTQNETRVKRYPFNPEYWNHCLMPRLEDFYFNKFIPEAIIAIEKERAWTPQNAKRTKSFYI